MQWAGVRAAVVTEMGTAESAGCLAAAVSVLSALPDHMLVTFFGAKDRCTLTHSLTHSLNSLF